MSNRNNKREGKKELNKKPKKTSKNKKQKNVENEKYNFENEIVIGVNVLPKNKNAKNNNNSKNTKKTQKEKAVKATKNKKVEKSNNKVKENKNDIKNSHIQSKKKINVLRILKILVAIVLIAITCIFLMTTPVFNINKIEIEGNTKITKERIESLSQVKKNVNTFRYSKSQIIKNIKEEPYIESVQIKRKLPDTMQIRVNERQVKFIIQYSSSYVYIDEQGYILEISNEILDVPMIYGIRTTQEQILPGNRLNDEDLEKMNTVLKIMECMENNDISQKITSIDIENKDDYILKMDENKKTIYIGDNSNINDKIAILKVILDKEEGNEGDIFVKDTKKTYFREKQ